MEITLAIIISIISTVISVINFALGRKDKSAKDSGDINYKMGVINTQLKQLLDKVEKIDNKLDTFDKEVEERNKMGLREEIEDMKKEVKEIEEGSLAMSLLADYKSQNKRQFIIILVILGMFACLLGYTIYLLNDIGVSTETDTIDIDNVETIDNSHIKIGDDVWEKSN